MSVSVVIPYFNGSRFLRRALESVIAQTVQPAEIIVVNDGSSDAETQQLNDFANKYPIRIIEKENGGQGSARNAGVRASTAPYICFLDQDDFFLEWHIEHLMSVAEEFGNERFAYAFGEMWRGDTEGNTLYHSWTEKFANHPKNDLFAYLGGDSYILPSATLIGRNAFEAIGGFDERLRGYEDEDLFTRLFAAGYTSVYTPRAVTSWTMNESSTSYSESLRRSRWLYFDKLQACYPDRPSLGRFVLRDYLFPRFFFQFVDDYLTACFLGDPLVARDRDRLRQFLVALQENPSCQNLKRQKRFLRILVQSSPPTVVRWGTLFSSTLGEIVLGNIGRRTIRPRLRELVWLRAQTLRQTRKEGS